MCLICRVLTVLIFTSLFIMQLQGHQAYGESYASSSEFPFALEIKRQFSANILKNGSFEGPADSNKCPEGWELFNGLQSKTVSYGVTTDAVDGKQGVFGRSGDNVPLYWVQSFTVKEGERYYCSVQAKFDGKCDFLLWIYTDQYNDPNGSWATKNSNTDVRDTASPGQGEGLEDFLDPEFLNYVSKDKWGKREAEFIVPKGHGVNTYTFHAGIYGVGWSIIDDACLGLAAFDISGVINGSNLKSLRIVDFVKASYLDINLDAGKSSQSFSGRLPSRLTHYFLEVTDTQGKTYRRAI